MYKYPEIVPTPASDRVEVTVKSPLTGFLIGNGYVPSVS
jgi:aldehyde:ferredoxin oxidoreductase